MLCMRETPPEINHSYLFSSGSINDAGETFSEWHVFGQPPPPRGEWKQLFCFQLPPHWFQLPTLNLSVLWYIVQNVADEQQRL